MRLLLTSNQDVLLFKNLWYIFTLYMVPKIFKFLNAHSESHGGRTILKIRRVDFLLKELLLAMTFF